MAMTVLQALADYRSYIVQANRLVASVHSTDAAGNYLWHPDDRTFVTEAAFLKLFVAWETFLEACFLEYLMGSPSIRGTILVKYASPINATHANDMLRGNKAFVDWSNPDEIRRLGKLYFDRGEPFETVLASVRGDILDMKVIRNAAAHVTTTTSAKLDVLGTRKLAQPCLNLSVYDLILAPDPNSSPAATIMQTYESLLDAAAHQIGHV